MSLYRCAGSCCWGRVYGTPPPPAAHSLRLPALVEEEESEAKSAPGDDLDHARCPIMHLSSCFEHADSQKWREVRIALTNSHERQGYFDCHNDIAKSFIQEEKNKQKKKKLFTVNALFLCSQNNQSINNQSAFCTPLGL